MVAVYNGRLFVLGTHYTTSSSQSVPKYIDQIQQIVGAEGYSVEVVDTPPRVIADFHANAGEGLWQNGGILGGTLTASVPGNFIGRIQSSVSFHHLYASSDAKRPTLAESGTGMRVLQFDGADELLAEDTDKGTAQSFMFELNTDQPRIIVVEKLDKRGRNRL